MDIERKRTVAAFCLASGILSVLLVVASLRPPGTPQEQLAFVAGRRGAVAFFAVTVLAWSVFSVPFVVALESLLREKSALFARAAMMLSACGILLLGFATFVHAGALLAIVEAGKPPVAGADVYHATVWTNLGFYLTDPGLMAWGLGQFLFGWLAWKGGVLPGWLAVVGMVGGGAGLATLAVYQTAALALLQIACFAAWGIATGIVLLRQRP